MITLHNVQGHPIAINGSLIERVDGGPETHVLLVSGTSYIVTESIEEVVRLHRADRAVVQALADSYPHDPVALLEGIPAGGGSLRLLGPGTSSGATGGGAADRDGDGRKPGDGEGARR